MKSDQTDAMRGLLDHLNAALVIADHLSESVIGAMLCECRERAEQLLLVSENERR